MQKDVKRIFVAFGVLAVLFLGITASGASQAAIGEDAHWVTPLVPSPMWHSATYQDEIVALDTYPHLSAEEVTADRTAWNRYLCTSTSDAHCQNKNYFRYLSLLPVCTNSSDTDCIEELSSVSTAGVSEVASFVNYTVPNHINKFPGDAKLGIPHSESPSLWNLPGTPHNFGTQYALAVGIKGTVRTSNIGNANEKQIFAYLVPVSTINQAAPRDRSPNGVTYDSLWEVTDSKGFTNTSGDGTSHDNCTFSLSEAGKCLTSHSFPDGSKFNLKLRLATEPTAWLHGRMVDPNITVTKNGTNTNVSVNASPTRVPIFYVGSSSKDLPEVANKFWKTCAESSCAIVAGGQGGESIDYHREWTQAYADSVNLFMYVSSFGNLPLEGLKILAPLVGDKSVAMPSAWSFHTLSSGEMDTANPCYTTGPGLKGIVSTNSTAYSEGPPSFVDGSLNYKVASAHFAPDGSVFKGSYNLVMRSDVARCIYKFSSAPVKASIEVMYEDGGSGSVATTAADERNGWLYLSANNFTFSSPTLKVKLTQAAELVAVPSPSAKTQAIAEPKKVISTKKTITCVKGKTSKKLNGLAPKCPAGYKKA